MTVIARPFGFVAVEAIFFLDITRVDDLEMPRLPPIERAVCDRRGGFAVNRHCEFAVTIFHGFLRHTSDSDRAGKRD
jgi:hypothetical protein